MKGTKSKPAISIGNIAALYRYYNVTIDADDRVTKQRLARAVNEQYPQGVWLYVDRYGVNVGAAVTGCRTAVQDMTLLYPFSSDQLEATASTCIAQCEHLRNDYFGKET